MIKIVQANVNKGKLITGQLSKYIQENDIKIVGICEPHVYDQKVTFINQNYNTLSFRSEDKNRNLFSNNNLFDKIYHDYFKNIINYCPLNNTSSNHTNNTSRNNLNINTNNLNNNMNQNDINLINPAQHTSPVNTTLQ